MTNIERYRYRIRFEKTELIRFISHLDLHRTWERTLRRAGLPVYHSQGFNPRPKINLSRALPLGQTSECEMLDVWLEAELEPDVILSKLKKAAPPGLILSKVDPVPLSEASIQSRITAATYRVSIPCQTHLEEVQSQIDRILEAKHLPRTRREKEYDLRPLLHSIEIVSSTNTEILLKMQLAAREGASGRPEEVLLEMGLDPVDARIHRTDIHFD